MEGHRNYPDPGYSEGTGRQGERAQAGESRYGAGDYGMPDPRRADVDPARAAADPGRGSVVGPRSGLTIPEEPTARRAGGASGAPGAPGSPGPAGEMYRSRRPGTAALFGVVAALLELPALVLLLDSTAGDSTSAAGVISALCVVAALPLLAVGLYSVATGAVRAAGPNSAQAWLRPPVAYLSVGLVLMIAAGLAA